jgi:hypothetical protein
VLECAVDSAREPRAIGFCPAPAAIRPAGGEALGDFRTAFLESAGEDRGRNQSLVRRRPKRAGALDLPRAVVAIWTSFQVVSYASIGLHYDLLEVFAWS